MRKISGLNINVVVSHFFFRLFKASASIYSSQTTTGVTPQTYTVLVGTR